MFVLDSGSGGQVEARWDNRITGAARSVKLLDAGPAVRAVVESRRLSPRLRWMNGAEANRDAVPCVNGDYHNRELHLFFV